MRNMKEKKVFLLELDIIFFLITKIFLQHSEKQQLVVVSECGDSMAAVQGLLKKHEALEAELAARGERVRDLSAEGEQLLAAGNLHSEALSHRLEQLKVL